MAGERKMFKARMILGLLIFCFSSVESYGSQFQKWKNPADVVVIIGGKKVWKSFDFLIKYWFLKTTTLLQRCSRNV
jgi:hypothetical protein